MSRGDRQEAIFLDDEDRWRFLKTLGEGLREGGWQVHAYCLMENLVVETLQPTLVAGMKWFFAKLHAEVQCAPPDAWGFLGLTSAASLHIIYELEAPNPARETKP